MSRAGVTLTISLPLASAIKFAASRAYATVKLASFKIVSVRVSVIVVPLAATAVTTFSPLVAFVTVKSSASAIKVSEVGVARASEVVRVTTFVPAVATAPDVAASSVEAFTLGRTPSTTIS